MEITTLMDEPNQDDASSPSEIPRNQLGNLAPPGDLGTVVPVVGNTPPASEAPNSNAGGDSISDPERRIRLRRAFDFFLIVILIVGVGDYALCWTYRRHGGYWYLYFGQHGPQAEICLLAMLAVITWWMRHILFPRQSLVSHPRPSAYALALLPAIARSPQTDAPTLYAEMTTGIKRCLVGSAFAALALGLALFYCSALYPYYPVRLGPPRLWLLLATFAAVGIYVIANIWHRMAATNLWHRVYNAWHQMDEVWKRYRGADNTWRAVGDAIFVWIHVQTSANQENAQTDAFKAETRGPWKYLLFVLIFIISLIAYSYAQKDYRWKVPPQYIWGWTLPFAFLCGCCWEVVWSVTLSYKPSNLDRKVKEMSQIYWLHKELHNDTTQLIWCLGAFLFLLFNFFGDFYISMTQWLYGITAALIVFIAIFPWIWVKAHAEDIINKHRVKREVEIAECFNKKYNSRNQNGWSDYQDEMNKLTEEITFLDDLKAKFDLVRWFEDRKKDVIPVAIINFVSTFLAIPLFETINHLVGK